MALRKLTKHSMVGNRAFHYFEKVGGGLARVSCSLEEYHALGMKDAGQPVHQEGLKWHGSTIEPEYDTVDGDLTDNSYAVLTDSGGETVAIKLAESEYAIVAPSAEIVDDEVEVTGL